MQGAKGTHTHIQNTIFCRSGGKPYTLRENFNGFSQQIMRRAYSFPSQTINLYTTTKHGRYTCHYYKIFIVVVWCGCSIKPKLKFKDVLSNWEQAHSFQEEFQF